MSILESILQVLLSEYNHLNEVECPLNVVIVLVDECVFILKEYLVEKRPLYKSYQLLHVLVFDYYLFHGGLLTKSHFLFENTHECVIKT